MAIRKKRLCQEEVAVIRYEGPRGGPGMPETLAVTMGLELYGYSRVALVTDGRFSGATSGPCVGHVSPEASEGGPTAAVRDGDSILVDIPGRRLEDRLSEEETAGRLVEFKPPRQGGASGIYAMIRQARRVGLKGRGARPGGPIVPPGTFVLARIIHIKRKGLSTCFA